MIVCEAILTPLALFLGKMCLLALYWRLFGHITHVRWEILAAVILSLPLLSSAVIMPVQAAPPRGKPWGTIVNNKNSEDNVLLALVIGVVSLLVDILIFCIPIPIVARLKLNRRKKAGILAIFMTGSM
jgi:hypothetical protein